VVSRLKAIIPASIDQPAVHRLDMDTSGLMVLGLTAAAHRLLSLQFARREVVKRYEALLEGEVAEEQGEINLSFRLDPNNRPYQVYDPVRGKAGVTRWRKIEVVNRRTLVEFLPLTGRTHQLRLHASHPSGLGCPIVGDRLYGSGQPGDRLGLHATFLRFIHPQWQYPLSFSSPAPFHPRPGAGGAAHDPFSGTGFSGRGGPA
jgi:tRNA pseudouridine32 synthase/23S rRNA pseudouridine746 synthase